MESKESQNEAKGCQRDPKGNRRAAKGNQGRTKMHAKVDLGAGVGIRCQKWGVGRSSFGAILEPFTPKRRSKIDA